MSFIPHHPAPGFGELVPGFFVVPQNPIVDTKDQSKYPDYFATNGEAPNPSGVKYVPKMAELLPAKFAVPQNPLVAQLRAGMTTGMAGCCCDSGGGSAGANPDDTGTGYVNGQPVMGGGGVEGMLGNIDWMTVGLALAAGWMLWGRK